MFAGYGLRSGPQWVWLRLQRWPPTLPAKVLLRALGCSNVRQLKMSAHYTAEFACALVAAAVKALQAQNSGVIEKFVLDAPLDEPSDSD